jgi:arsenate reductase
MKKKLLFICTGNAVRSQMAHALFNDMTNYQHLVYSAGIKPAGVHPMTKKVMADVNISLLNHTSNHVNEMINIEFDYIIVLCEVACMNLPKFKGNYKFLKWFIDDPIRIIGSDERKEKAFTFTRGIIYKRIQDFIQKEGL